MKVITVLICCFVLISCKFYSRFEIDEDFGSLSLDFCLQKIKEVTGSELSDEVTIAYIEVFNDGFTVGFTKGSDGSFGARDQNYKMIIACGVSTKFEKKELAFLRSPVSEDYYFDASIEDYSDFSREVVEMLFYREGDDFKFCCSQKFDEDNIQKNNPHITW